MDYEIEKINGDNWRPGMPEKGWLVRYGINEHGWMYRKCYEDESTARAFTKILENTEIRQEI